MKVTNLKTDESVVVTVTDCLAPGNTTIIDISRKAAREIGNGASRAGAGKRGSPASWERTLAKCKPTRSTARVQNRTFPIGF